MQPDFSGTYTAKHKVGKTLESLRVIQTESSIEVTRVIDDKEYTTSFLLDGSVGEYTTVRGVHGKSKAQLKDKTLLLETFVASPPDAKGTSTRFHTRETWQLSGDNKKLTIKTEMDSPDMPPQMMSAAFPNNPRSETYLRSEKP
jgi:hypothetical protein